MLLRILLISVFLPTVAAAQNWPAELTYKGAPLSSACIDKIITTLQPDESMALEECTQTSAAPEQTTETEASIAHSSSTYLGRFRGGFVLYSLSNSGGTGQFSDISILKRKGDNISLYRKVASGDRCNGGITEAWMERGKLFYKINLTPYDIVAHADTATNLKAYDDLESSAASCFAIATFTHAHDNQPVLQLVSLNPDVEISSDEAWVRKFEYQPCFNTYFTNAVTTGKTSLNRDQLKTFVDGFYAQCVTQKTIEATPLESPAPNAETEAPAPSASDTDLPREE